MSVLARHAARSWNRVPLLRRTPIARFSTSRQWREELYPSQRVDYQSKYAEKLQKRAAEEGITVEQLQQRMKEQEKTKRKEKLATPLTFQSATASSLSQAQPAQASGTTAPAPSAVRKDSSPVKPLSNILNLEKLLKTPHTAEQISLLWLTYHSSRSGGTGRGYLCATIPVDTYEKMASVASRYPNFIVPVPRDASQAGGPVGDDKRAYEFYFMEWGFHGTPVDPQSTLDIFQKPQPSNNPQTSTVLFTPLQEYKLRNSFATPYIVLTHYTDLARSHGIVLLRGEITPSSGTATEGDGRYMLNQRDAQLLAMGTQKFYLWQDEQGEGATLLKTFHNNPSEFNWEDLLKHADFSA